MPADAVPNLVGEFLQNAVSSVYLHPPYGDKFAGFFCALWAEQKEDLNWVSSQLEGRDALLLDVGCGDGRLSSELVTADRDVVGIDLNSAMIDRAETSKRGRQSDGCVTPDYFLGDFADYNWGQARVGNVLCMGLTSAVIDFESLEKLISLSAAHLPEGGLLLMDFLDRSAIMPGSSTTIPVVSKKAGDKVLYWIESRVDRLTLSQTTFVTRFASSRVAGGTQVDTCRLVSRPIDLDCVLELARRYGFECDLFRVSSASETLANRLVYARLERRAK